MKIPAGAFLLSLSLITRLCAAVDIIVEPLVVGYGSDVRIRWSGSLDTSGVSWALASASSIPGGVNPASGGVFGYAPGGSAIALSQVGMLAPGAIAFGTGSLSNSNLFSGEPLGLDGAGRIGVPAGYVSGTPLSGSIRFPNQNLASLGLTPSGPLVWTMPSGDTITLSYSDQTVVLVDFQTGGEVGDVIAPLNYGDLTITISDVAGDAQEPRIAEYGDGSLYGFAGSAPGVAADPSAVSASRYLASAGPSGGPFSFTTMEFAFSKPVRSFGLATVDMTEAVTGASPLLLSGLDADGSVLAQTVIDSPSDTGNGAVFPIQVGADGNRIHKVRFEGPATGHGIDDLVIIRDPETEPPQPPSILQPIHPPAGWDSVTIEDMSDDGSRIVGRLFRSSDFSYKAFLWSEDDGFSLLEGLPGAISDGVSGISGDGNVVLGWTPSDTDTNKDNSWVHRSGTTSAVPWISATEYNAAAAISFDGSVLGGSCDTNLAANTWATRPASWLWNGSTYAGTALPSAWPGVTAFANLGWLEAVSGDGRYLFGKHAVQSGPAVYHSYRIDRSNGSIDEIGNPNNLNIVQSNHDGSRVLAYRSRSYAYLWEPGTGIELLPFRPAQGWTGYSYRAVGMSETADRIIAYEDAFAIGSLIGTRLVYWDQDHELHGFLGMLEAQGIDLTNWTIQSLDAISSDGRIIAGEARADGTNVGFRLSLPAGPLPANPVEAILFGPDGFFDPSDGAGVTGLDADGDGDGVPNVVEIALGSIDGSGAVVMNDPSDPSSTPQIHVEVADPADPALSLTAFRRRDISGLSVRMEWTGSLGNGWSSTGVTETVTPIDDTWEQVTFSAPDGNSSQFARLVADYAE